MTGSGVFMSCTNQQQSGLPCTESPVPGSSVDIRRFSVVLCRAQEAGNIGSVCRAMKTMGLHDLVLADCPPFDEDRVRTMSVHAYDIYENSTRHDSLESALKPFARSAGFTRRRGQGRKNFSLSVSDFSSRETGKSGPVALVFGNERDGLSGEELALCSLAVHIPTSEDFPSLNLSQAVQIACWELWKLEVGREDGTAQPARRDDSAQAVARIAGDLEKIGFFRQTGGVMLRRFLRDTVERAGLTPMELRYFEGLFRKTVALSLAGTPARPLDEELSDPSPPEPVLPPDQGDSQFRHSP